MKAVYICCAAVLSLVASLAVAPQASAAGTVSLTPPRDLVLYEDCYDYTYGYTVAAPTADWSLDVSITDPYGADESSDYILDSDGPSGTETIYLCGDGIDRPGAYGITATLTWYDSDFTSHTEPPTTISFVLQNPATVTTLRVSDTRPDFNDKVRFRIVSRIQARVGYARLDYERVRLEAYLNGAWRKFEGKTTDGDGIARFVYKWNIRRAVKFRAVTPATASHKLSKSSPITVRL